MVQGLASPAGATGTREVIAPCDSLEHRVQRLEDAVAALQDTSRVEEHVLERVQGLLQARPDQAPAVSGRAATAQQMYDAARFTVAPPNAPPRAAPALADPLAAPPARLLHAPWLLFDLFAEMRAMVLMFFDIHYHTAWTTRLIALVVVPLILLSHLWFPFAWVPIIGPVVDKLVDLALAFFLYKALGREAQRYLETRSGRR